MNIAVICRQDMNAAVMCRHDTILTHYGDLERVDEDLDELVDAEHEDAVIGAAVPLCVGMT